MHAHTYIHAYMHAYTHTDMHACMHTYIHTYMHAHIQGAAAGRLRHGEGSEWGGRGGRVVEADARAAT